MSKRNLKKALEQAEKIYDTIGSRSFAEWYGADDDSGFGAPFVEHIAGMEDGPTKEMILNEIIRIFRLPI